MKSKSEFDKFERMMRNILTATHDELKIKLDAEKKRKPKKKRKAK